MTTGDTGNLNVRYDTPLIAGSLVTIAFEYTAGPAGLPEGSRLRLGLPCVGWAVPLVPQHYFWSAYARGRDRTYTDYDRVNTTVRLQTDSKAQAFLQVEARFRKPWTFPPSWLRDYDRYWITVTLEDDGLGAGDRMIVTYGDPEQHPLTARVQGFPESKACFLAFVDPDGTGNFEEVPGSPWPVSVAPGPVARMAIVVPSIVRAAENPAARVAYTDAVHAAPEPVPDVGTLLVSGGASDARERWVPVDRKTDAVSMPVPELAWHRDPLAAARIEVRDPARDLHAVSNPSLVRPTGQRLYWGDLHGQSQYHGWNPDEQVGISCNTPGECYRYARDIAGLDFCAVTDSRSIANDIWVATVQAALRMTEPGRFVAFQASEVGDNVDGHRNLIFAGADPEPGIPASRASDRADVLEVLKTRSVRQRYAGRKDVLLLPHHTKMWLNWDVLDPELEPVLEIYSIWGSGEKAGTDLWEVLREMSGGAQEAWARGIRVGVIAGSDTHAGMPGRSLPWSDRDDFLIYKAGFAAVWADELTRQSLFAALKARRCYGTTGVRIVLEVFLNGQPMGSEIDWSCPDAVRTLSIRVWGTDELETVTVVKNNESVHTFRPRGEHADLCWDDTIAARDGDYYYVRVRQRDNNRAWASPIWLNVQPAAPGAQAPPSS